MNTPKIRFPDFNNEYNDIVFSTIANKISKRNKENNITNVISNSALHGLISQREFFDKDIANNDNTENYYIIEKNDFVYNPRKSNQAPYGPINLYKYDTPGVISPLYLCFKTKNNDPNYLEYYFKSSCWHRYIYLNGDSGARHDRVSIRDDVFFNMNIKIPSKEEQLKIANFLSLLDKKIELQSKKIEALKLFTKNTILNKLNNLENYNLCKLKEICSIQTGKSNTQDRCDEGIYPFYIRSENVEKSNKYIFDCEAVLTIGDGNIGKVFFYENGKFDCHQRVYVLNNFRNVLGKYVYYYFSSFFYKRAMSMSAKNTVDSVRMEMISDMIIKVPKENEQIKMINLFSSLDKKLELEQNKLDKLHELKKGLMQNMFV